MMKHYDLLEKLQVKAWKEMYNKFHKPPQEEPDEETQRAMNHPMVKLAAQMDNRDAKIAAYKLKKQIEGNLDLLRNCKDEEKQREFYKCQLQLSIMKSFEQL